MAKERKARGALPSKTADDALFKLHDKFCEGYNTMLSLSAGASSPGGSKLNKQWNRAVGIAFDRAGDVINAPAYTLEGMLMKLHIFGFTVAYRKKDSFSTPYHGQICANGRPQQQWEMQEDRADEEAELALILCLRADLQRFAGRRT